MRSHAQPWFSDGSTPVGAISSVDALVFCPAHQVEDKCHAEALQAAWERLKAQHTAHCHRSDCEVSDRYVTITHGPAAVTADTVFWWREMRWL